MTVEEEAVFTGGRREASNWLTSMLRMVLDSSVAGFVEMELEDEDEDEDDKDDDDDDDDDADNDDDDEIEEEEEEEEEETVLPSGLYFFRVNLCFLVWDGRSGEFDREREEKLQMNSPGMLLHWQYR